MSFHPLADGDGDDGAVRVLDRLVAIASKSVRKCNNQFLGRDHLVQP